MAESEKLSKKIDQLLYGQAVLSLRQKFSGSGEPFSMKQIQEEQKRLKSAYDKRDVNQPPIDPSGRQL